MKELTQKLLRYKYLKIKRFIIVEVIRLTSVLVDLLNFYIPVANINTQEYLNEGMIFKKTRELPVKFV